MTFGAHFTHSQTSPAPPPPLQVIIAQSLFASSKFKTASVAVEQRALWYFPPETSFETSLRVDL